jgi:hypothetical protein
VRIKAKLGIWYRLQLEPDIIDRTQPNLPAIRDFLSLTNYPYFQDKTRQSRPRSLDTAFKTAFFKKKGMQTEI